MHKITTLFIALLLLQSCKDGSELSGQEIPQPTLTLSDSPIDLEGIEASFAPDINYDSGERNVFDIFLPASETPTPLVIYIHGGGFLGGQKENPYEVMWTGSWDFPAEIRTLLANKIAFATINYRLLAFKGDQEGVWKSLNDSKRCLQYIRSISTTLNIDKNNIILAGSSAGAGTAQWLAFSDDMAKPLSNDPVLRESTRVKALAVKATQASYDLLRYETDIFKEYNFTWKQYFKEDPDMKPRFKSFYGINDFDEFYTDSITTYRSKVDMLAKMSSDDPEFWASNPQTPLVKPTQSNVANHHAYHVRTLKSYADKLGIPNVAYYGDYEDASGETFVDFMIRKANE